MKLFIYQTKLELNEETPNLAKNKYFTNTTK